MNAFVLANNQIRLYEAIRQYDAEFQRKQRSLRESAEYVNRLHHRELPELDQARYQVRIATASTHAQLVRVREDVTALTLFKQHLAAELTKRNQEISSERCQLNHASLVVNRESKEALKFLQSTIGSISLLKPSIKAERKHQLTQFALQEKELLTDIDVHKDLEIERDNLMQEMKGKQEKVMKMKQQIEKEKEEFSCLHEQPFQFCDTKTDKEICWLEKELNVNEQETASVMSAIMKAKEEKERLFNRQNPLSHSQQHDESVGNSCITAAAEASNVSPSTSHAMQSISSTPFTFHRNNSLSGPELVSDCFQNSNPLMMDTEFSLLPSWDQEHRGASSAVPAPRAFRPAQPMMRYPGTAAPTGSMVSVVAPWCPAGASVGVSHDENSLSATASPAVQSSRWKFYHKVMGSDGPILPFPQPFNDTEMDVSPL